MPYSFIGLIIVFIVMVGFFISSRRQSDASGRRADRVVSLCAGALFVLLLLYSTVSIVGTRKAGVVTEFGNPVRSLDNGIHLKAPWQKVETLDGAVQTDSYVGYTDGNNSCTDIRIGNASTACVDNTIRWRIRTPYARDLYRDYRNMETIRDSLVTRELNASLNQVLGDYNPLDAVRDLEVSGSEQPPAESLEDFAAEVTARMQERVGDRVEILSVTIPLIRYDDSTQERLNEYQAEIANTRIAAQRELTAKKQAAANEALSASVSNDPYVLVSYCLDTLAEMVKAGQVVPAGFSCWPGGGSAIVVPSASPQPAG